MCSQNQPTSLLGPLLPDELIWSYYARILGRFPALNFQKLPTLLGGLLPSYSKSFPTRLGALAGAFKFPAAPDAEALARGHTFFPIAALEVSRITAMQLLRTMAEDSFPTGVSDRLVLSGNFKLRCCPICAREDLTRGIGAPYWRRMHQIPEVRICLKHRSPLRETAVTAGLRTPVPLATAMTESRPLDLGSVPLQMILAAAYAAILGRAKLPDGDQLSDAFATILRDYGHLDRGQLSENLIARVAQEVGADEVIGDTRRRAIATWRTVPQIAIVLHVLGISFEAFLGRALQVPVRDQATIRASTEREREVAENVRALAPMAVAMLHLNPRRISRWAIATALKPQFGPGFVSNWSFQPLVKAALEEFAETPHQHLARILGQIRANPAGARACCSYQGFLQRFRVSQALSKVFKEELHAAYREGRGDFLL